MYLGTNFIVFTSFIVFIALVWAIRTAQRAASLSLEISIAGYLPSRYVIKSLVLDIYANTSVRARERLT